MQNFRYGGIAHIFAVSGLHIGVIYGLLYGILRRLRVKGFVRLPVVFAALLFYCGVCGFSPSSVRALVMCTVLMIADAAGYAYDRLNSVSAASLVVLVINPVYLFSVGFQLSVAAAAGIIVLGGHLGRRGHSLLPGLHRAPGNEPYHLDLPHRSGRLRVGGQVHDSQSGTFLVERRT